MKQHRYRQWKLFSVLLLTGVLISAFAGILPGLRGMESQPVQVHAASACVSPPAGFNPLTASADQSRLYGFPPRPSIQGAREVLWENLVKGAKKRLCQSVQTGKSFDALQNLGGSSTTASAVTSAVTTQPTTTSGTNQVYSGYYVEGQTFTESYGEFQVACPTASLAPYTSAFSAVALGSRYFAVGVTQEPSHQFFWVLGSGTVNYVSDYVPACSDNIKADAQYDPNTNSADLFIEDTSQNGVYFSQPQLNYRPNQTNAAWLEFRASPISSVPENLYNFGSVNWTAVEYAAGNTLVSALAGNVNIVQMTMRSRTTTHVLATPGPLTPSQDSSGNAAAKFTDTFIAAS